MADETKTRGAASAASAASAAAHVPVIDDAVHSPVIFFDSVPAFGVIKGTFAATLATGRWLEIDGRLEVRPVVVGHLRMSAEGAAALRDALDKSLLAMTKVAGSPN